MAQETKVDVLICGSGSAGLCAAVWLARAGINFRILESRDGPLQLGQADGVQARTVEIFESFGLERPLLDESYHVLELAFWSRNDRGEIQCSRYAPDLMPGLSHQPHVILNQARVNMLMIEDIRNSLNGDDQIEYGQQVQGVTVDEAAVGDPDKYCTTVTSVKGGQEHVFRAKYVLGCDGAHSIVRKSLGIKMEGDSTDSKWGVMDVYVRTDFPDIRKKSIISSNHGNLLIIPREGDFLVRFYLELHDAGDKQIPFEKLVEQASRIFSPYTLEVVETVWWSTYSIGQRLADSFSVSDRVLLTGDACHTHSPKAGQGMNVSLQDGHNLGWKLAAVLSGQASPSVLATYVLERQKTATELIDFDRKFTKLFSSTYRQANGVSAGDFESAFIEAGRFTAGQATKYPESILTRAAVCSSLETSVLKLGMRFPTARVVRQSDALSMQLVRAMPADGRWHIVVFGGSICNDASSARLNEVAKHLDSLVQRFTPVGADSDAVFNILLVLAGRRHDLGLNEIRNVFMPVTGKWKIKNLHKVFFDDDSYDQGHGQAYKQFGIDSLTGCAIVTRPDQYIAKISSLGQVDSFQDFFAGFMLCTPQL